MSSTQPAKGGVTDGFGPRQIIAIVIAVVAVALIAANWNEAQVSLLVASVTMPLTILLAIVFVGGMATGALLSNRRKKG
jgi:uncharacterized membrane protein YciS (DUF1049 family)